jgi:hypothetical protein
MDLSFIELKNSRAAAIVATFRKYPILEVAEVARKLRNKWKSVSSCSKNIFDFSI